MKAVLALALLALTLPCLTQASTMTAWTNPTCSGSPAVVSTFTVGMCTVNNDGSSYQVSTMQRQRCSLADSWSYIEPKGCL